MSDLHPASGRPQSESRRHPFLPNRNSAVEIQPRSQQQQQQQSGDSASSGEKDKQQQQSRLHQFGRHPSGLGGLLSQGSLEKRPTFEGGLDKRKSWSVDVSGGVGVGNKPSAAPLTRPRPTMPNSSSADKALTPGQLRNARGQTLREVQQMQQPGSKKAMLALNSKG